MTDYWLARTSRRYPLGFFVTSVGWFGGLSVYYCAHTYCLNTIKKFYAYVDKNGERETLSPRLRKLIGEVYMEARDKTFLNYNNIKGRVVYSWYASSTMEPVTHGYTSFKTGVMSGLPFFYNYESFNDIPDEVLTIRRIKLFRNPLKQVKGTHVDDSELAEVKKALSDEDSQDERSVVIYKFDRDTQEGREYMDTLILSDDAKKFAILKELLLGDTWTVILKMIYIGLVGGLSIVSAEACNSVLLPGTIHAAVRLPVYLSCSAFGLVLLKTLDPNKKHQKMCKDHAKLAGEAYVRGAEEFYKKSRRRREILRSVNPEDDI